MAGRSNSPPDLFRSVREATLAHIRDHGCGCYPFFDGSLLGVVAAATQATRILELGTALGYTATWFAHGAPQAIIDTIEFDPDHVRIARENIVKAGYGNRVIVHHGDFAEVLPTLKPAYDIGFFDGWAPTLNDLEHFHRLLRPRGVLISTNLDMGGGQASKYRGELADSKRWLSTFAAEDSRTAISIKL
jgi:predicted O-methyltransferase YrrM